MSVDVFLILILILTLVYMWTKSKNVKKETAPTELQRKKEIPGMEPTDSKLGNLLDMKAVGEIGEFLDKLHTRYGPIASFWMKKQRIVSIASAEYFKHQIKIFDRPAIFFEGLCPLVGINGIQFINGETARIRHQIYSKCLNVASCNNSHLDTLIQNARQLTSELESSLTREPMLLMPYLAKVVGKNAVKCVTGEELEDSEAEKMMDNYNTSCKGLGYYFQYSYEDRENTPLPEYAVTAIEAWRRMISNQITKRLKRRENGEEIQQNIILDWMLDENISESDVMEDTNMIIMAGFHTTVYLLLWSLYYMGQNMDIQEKVYQEVNEHIQEINDMNAENLSKLTYLRQCIDETLRRARVGSYSARICEDDHTLGQYVIPKGTPVIHSLSTALMDPKYFPNPEKYDPERFNPANTKERTNISFSPFGFAGKRVCVGYQFAYCEAKVVLAWLLKKFVFRCPQDKMEVNAKHGLVPVPTEDIQLYLSLREQ